MPTLCLHSSFNENDLVCFEMIYILKNDCSFYFGLMIFFFFFLGTQFAITSSSQQTGQFYGFMFSFLFEWNETKRIFFWAIYVFQWICNTKSKQLIWIWMINTSTKHYCVLQLRWITIHFCATNRVKQMQNPYQIAIYMNDLRARSSVLSYSIHHTAHESRWRAVVHRYTICFLRLSLDI